MHPVPPRGGLSETDGKLRPVKRRCDEFYVPSPGRTAYGLTHIVRADLADPERQVGGVYVLGASSVVYSNADTLVVGPDDVTATPGRTGTLPHSFALDGRQTDYVASGAVTGRVLNQKAFNFFAERNLLAFPYVDASRARTSLQVFHVDTDSGFEFLGSVEHQALAANCLGAQASSAPDDAVFWGCPDPSVRRGVFIGDHVYSISYGGVLVHDVGELRRAAVRAMRSPA